MFVDVLASRTFIVTFAFLEGSDFLCHEPSDDLAITQRLNHSHLEIGNIKAAFKDC